MARRNRAKGPWREVGRLAPIDVAGNRRRSSSRCTRCSIGMPPGGEPDLARLRTGSRRPHGASSWPGSAPGSRSWGAVSGAPIRSWPGMLPSPSPTSSSARRRRPAGILRACVTSLIGSRCGVALRSRSRCAAGLRRAGRRRPSSSTTTWHGVLRTAPEPGPAPGDPDRGAAGGAGRGNVGQVGLDRRTGAEGGARYRVRGVSGGSYRSGQGASARRPPTDRSSPSCVR